HIDLSKTKSHFPPPNSVIHFSTSLGDVKFAWISALNFSFEDSLKLTTSNGKDVGKSKLNCSGMMLTSPIKYLFAKNNPGWFREPAGRIYCFVSARCLDIFAGIQISFANGKTAYGKSPTDGAHTVQCVFIRVGAGSC